MVPMKLFYRTSAKSATQILREGFQDRADPTGTNLGFYDQIPAIKTVWFTDIPLKGNEDRLLVLEIPDNVVQQLDRTVRMGLWGRSSLPHFNRYRPNEREGNDDVLSIDVLGKPYTEWLIPAEMANQYGPPKDVSDNEDEYLPNRGLF